MRPCASAESAFLRPDKAIHRSGIQYPHKARAVSVLEIAGEHFRFDVQGPEGAPPLVLAHSLGTTLELFDAVTPLLASRFRVVRYDLRGHGESTAPDAVHGMGDLGRDFINLVEGLKLGPVHFCGLSLGGMVGQWLAIHAPKRLKRIVLSNTTAYAGPPRIWEARIKAVRRTGTDHIADAVIDSWFSSGVKARMPDTVARVREMIAATPAVGYAATSCAMRDMDFRAALHKVTTPTLVIVSDEDRSTPPEWGEAVAQGIPGAQLARLPGGHLSCLEQPEAFAKTVLDFLG
ncbi:alpha/beta hydrolase [Azorhizobium caulinodans ORS 571]|uniref:Alpha/beta hydrolase n=1 Tax=Azorhizobium caulinodans (strain ATCC 43989 / DSM 5975 / JCM 20966 / LMG 6465 / NBRC 14845 / NCIMB 13405 / ORS 571) TaxID=438753 RepID=A8IIV7_AZOC5|nr:alpha/beta hydrolase [Azorhizobium caulinodans ORS 571]